MSKNAGKIEGKLNGKTLTVALRGEIDHHSATQMRVDIDKLIFKTRPATLILDVSDIDFMDSSGLGLLMGRLRLMKEIGGAMALLRPNRRVLKILELSGMERFMEIDGVKGKGER